MSIANRKKSILRKNPYHDRRSFIARLNPLSPIGDIANATLSEITSGSLTWETASDWDNSVSESGVVHDSFGDLPGDGVIQLGYPNVDRGGTNLIGLLPLDESTGPVSTADGSISGTVNGATLGSGGLLDTTAVSFDGSNDRIEFGDEFVSTTGDVSYFGWIYPTNLSTGSDQFIFERRNDLGNRYTEHSYYINDSTNILTFNVNDGSGWVNSPANTAITANTWQSVGVSVDGGNSITHYQDGSPDGSTSISWSVPNHQNTPKCWMGMEPGDTDRPYAGRIEVWHVFDRALSSSEIQALHDAATSGVLTSGTKSFVTATKPDLSNLSYSLNSQSITLDVIGSPGTASEEVVSKTLDGSSSYSLAWSSSHTDFRIRPNLSTTDKTATPTFSAATLV